MTQDDDKGVTYLAFRSRTQTIPSKASGPLFSTFMVFIRVFGELVFVTIGNYQVYFFCRIPYSIIENVTNKIILNTSTEITFLKYIFLYNV